MLGKLLIVGLGSCQGDLSVLEESPPPLIFKPGTVKLQARTYKTLQFTANGPIWMTQNLNHAIPDSWCYDDEPQKCRRYGRLYTWESAQSACSKLGWRLPTDQEWQAITKRFGGATNSDLLNEGQRAYEALIDGGTTGFNVLLGGFRYPEHPNYHLTFGLGEQGTYWTATEASILTAWSYTFSFFYGSVYRQHELDSKNHGKSSRCVKDP